MARSHTRTVVSAAVTTSICSADCGPACWSTGRRPSNPAIRHLSRSDAKDDDAFEFDDERLAAMGAKTAEAFNAAVRQRLDRDRDRLTR